MTIRSAIVGLVALAIAAPLCAHAQTAAPKRAFEWDEETINLFSTLPIQDGGRVKPLSTYAGFTLLKLNGRRACYDTEGNKLTPMAWFMDCLFFPEAAEHYRTFLVQDSDVLDAIKVSHADKKKRDRYSFIELFPGISELFRQAHEIQGRLDQKLVEQKDLSLKEHQILNLASNVFQFQQITHYLDFAREPLPIDDQSALRALLPNGSFTEALDRGPVLGMISIVLEHGMENVERQLPPATLDQLRSQLPPAFANLDAATREKNLRDLQRVEEYLSMMQTRAGGLAILPPTAPLGDQEHWLAVGDIVSLAFSAEVDLEPQLAHVRILEETALATNNPPQFKLLASKFHDEIVSLAQQRGEYRKIPLEVSYYNYDFLYYSLILFILVFIVAAVSWLLPYRRFLANLYPMLLAPPTALLITAIVYRCIIRGRPPVSTLYETILFITAVAVLVTIFIEFVNKQKIAFSLGALLGSLGLFLAYRYEAKEGVDTMPSLVAVLDTNFWLSTHVTTVTMGYSAGLLAAAIAHVYIFGKLFGMNRNDTGFYKSVSRMTYGVLCFGLVFSVVGTVLGGIWANESWGRFWGWDPKENGALMIVLWELAILHARMGGYIRDLGVAVASVFGAIVVAFSWWGVNLLGVGLHSYGFTSGIFKILLAFYAIECIVILCGIALWLRERTPQPAKAPAPARSPRKPIPAKASQK